MATSGWDMAKLVRILCALALLCLGLSHKPPVVAVPDIGIEDFAYHVLPDGTIPDLCLTSVDRDGKGHRSSSGCEACRLNASTLPPTPADIVGEPIRREIVYIIVARVEARYRQLFPPNTSPRGPPSGLIA